MLQNPGAAAQMATSTELQPVGLAGPALLFAGELAKLPAKSVTPYVYDWRVGVAAASPAGLGSNTWAAPVLRNVA